MGHFKLVQSGSLVETYSFSKDIHYGFRRKNRLRKLRKKGSVPLYRREDNVRAATKSFRRLVRANFRSDSNPVLLTLTMLSLLSLETSRSLLRRFFNRLNKLNGHRITYVAVPEWQERGAVHFHVLIWGLNEQIVASEYETRNIQRIWLRGFCDCVATDGSPKLVGYLTKYMSKSMRDKRLRGQRAYTVSRNSMRSVSTKVPSSLVEDVLPEIVGPDAVPTYSHTFETRWLGTCTYSRYDIDIGKAPEGA